MTAQIINLECGGCGASVSLNQKTCEYCNRPIVISTFSGVASLPLPEVNKYAGVYRKALSEHPDNQELNLSIALCYLKLKLYDRAIPCFERAMEDNFDNSETFFYASIALLRGKKAFVTPRADIDKILEYLNAALMIEDRGIYHYMLAYIKYDYFHRKYLNISPDYLAEYKLSQSSGVSEGDIAGLFSLLGVDPPNLS
jgi:tetratricopeptide (TPR) repeat protein